VKAEGESRFGIMLGFAIRELFVQMGGERNQLRMLGEFNRSAEPPLWSSGQSPGYRHKGTQFGSQRCQIFGEVVI
jgi:hypothetical protein